MKYVIVSDIHGSFYYAKKIQEIMDYEKAEKLVVLGDFYYHGPRNPLPKDYNPMEVAKILNLYKDKIIAIKGNCDAEVDEMISEFKFNEYYNFEVNSKKIFLTHGHKFNKDNWPEQIFDIMFYGHFHTGFIIKEKEKIFVNPGSISLPKQNTVNSYIVLENDKIILKDVNFKIINEMEF